MKRLFYFVIVSFLYLNYLQTDEIYIGYIQQTQILDFQNCINSPLSFLVKDNYLTFVNPKGQGIVYFSPPSELIILNYGGILPEPIPLSENIPFDFSFHHEYYYDENLCLVADFYFHAIYTQNQIFGTLDLYAVSVNPSCKIYQGIYHFNFSSGINNGNKLIGYYKQTNNSNSEGFINAPFNVTIDNNNLLYWNELNQDIVYITKQFYLINLPFGSQFNPPIPIEDNVPFHIDFENDYEENGEVVLIAYYSIDGVKKESYLQGSMSANIVAINPDYNSYKGNYTWAFEAGIEKEINCNYSINPEIQYLPSSGGNYSFEISTKNECFWQIYTEDSWININSSTFGYGNYSGEYTVLPNEENFPRNGYIYLKDGNGVIWEILTLKQLNLDCPSIKGNYDIYGGTLDIEILGNYAYIADFDTGFHIVDISNPSNPQGIGHYNISEALDLAIYGNYAFIVTLDYGFYIFDISNPSSPQLVNNINFFTSLRAIEISGNYAFIVGYFIPLLIFDISNPSNLQLIEAYNNYTSANGIAVSANYAFLADGELGLKIIDTSDPTNPYEISSISTSGEVFSTFIKGNYCYLADGDIRILDISDPYFPKEIGFYKTPNFAYNITLSENYGYIADSSTGLIILDLSDPSSPKSLGQYTINSSAVKTKVFENYCYVANLNGGFKIFQISCLTDCQKNLGDVNENNFITSYDSSILLQYIVGLVDLSPSQKCKSDVNLNNSISSLDASFILQCVIGNCSNFPAEFFLSCKNHNNCL